MRNVLTLEELLNREQEYVLIDMAEELLVGVVPATGYTHQYVRKVNKMIDDGDLCINSQTYRKVYLPTFAKAVNKELARRFVNHVTNKK